MLRNNVNMLSGPIIPGLIRMSIPIMVMQIAQALFNIADMAILKVFDSSGIAVGAVGACTILISLFTVMAVGISSGSNVVIARHIGSSEQDSVERSVGTSLVLAVLSGVLLFAVGFFLTDWLLSLVNCPTEFLTQSVLYLKVSFISLPFVVLYNFSAAILRATGDTGRPMIYLIIGGVLKVAATYVFSGPLKMGVLGVALSTVISWAVAAALTFFALLREKGVVKINSRRLKIYRRELLEILFIGLPAAAQPIFFTVANLMLTATVNSFGAAASTSYSIGTTFENIIYQMAVASALAIMPYVSQNVGNRNIKRARQAVRGGILITVVLICFFGWLSALFSRQLASMMSDDPTVIALARQKMILVSTPYFIYGISEVLCAAMRGLGRPIVAALTSLTHMCVIRIFWIYVIFPLNPELWFLYLIWPIGWVLVTLTILCFYFPTMKRLKQKIERKDVSEQIPKA